VGTAAAPTTFGAPLPPGVHEHFIDAGGVKFRYLKGGAHEHGKPPVLLIHGWPSWAEVWLPVAEALGATHPWIAVDLPGHGKSTPLPGKDGSLTALRGAVGAFVDGLELKRFSVVGCSIGGTLAVMLALDRPQAVERIVPIDAAGFAPKLPGKTVRMYLPFFLRASLGAPGAGGVRKLLNKAVFVDPANTTEGWVSAMVGVWAGKTQRRSLLKTGGALRRPDASVAGRLGDVKCPTLILWGKGDPQFGWRIGEEASRKIPGARFVGIENAGHFPQVEQPQATAAALAEFFSHA